MIHVVLDSEQDGRPSLDLLAAPTFHPTVRSFREVVVHLVGENYLFFGRVAGENLGNPAQNLKTREELLKALRESYAYGEKVWGDLTEEKALQIIRVLSHVALAGARKLVGAGWAGDAPLPPGGVCVNPGGVPRITSEITTTLRTKEGVRMIPPEAVPAVALFHGCHPRRQTRTAVFAGGQWHLWLCATFSSPWRHGAALLTPRDALLALLDNLIRSQQNGLRNR